MKIPVFAFKKIRWLILVGLTFCLTVTSTAQNICDVRVTDVFNTVNRLCNNMERDRLCYGNVLVEAQAQPGVVSLGFEKPGDLVSVNDVKSIQLSPMDMTQGTWGIARLRLVPATANSVDDDVVLLFFGNVTVEDHSKSRNAFDFTVISDYNIHLRNFPALESTILGIVEQGSTVRALGRLEDGSWLRVQKLPAGTIGWINTEVLQADDLSQIDRLLVEGSSDPYYGPMQAFYFESGSTTVTECQQVPDGLLIQTPEGTTRVTLLINEVTFDLVNKGGGATAFLQAQPTGDMRISLLEGAAYVGAGGSSIFVPPGAQVHVPLNANLAPIGTPTLPVPNQEPRAAGIPGLKRNPAEIIWSPQRPAEPDQAPLLVTVVANNTSSETIDISTTAINALSNQQMILNTATDVTPATGEASSTNSALSTAPVTVPVTPPGISSTNSLPPENANSQPGNGSVDPINPVSNPVVANPGDTITTVVDTPSSPPGDNPAGEGNNNDRERNSWLVWLLALLD